MLQSYSIPSMYRSVGLKVWTSRCIGDSYMYIYYGTGEHGRSIVWFGIENVRCATFESMGGPFTLRRRPNVKPTLFQYDTPRVLTLVLLNCCLNCGIVVFFIHLKLELLTQFPASNEWKILLFVKNIQYPIWNYWINLTSTKTISSNFVIFPLI